MEITLAFPKSLKLFIHLAVNFDYLGVFLFCLFYIESWSDLFILMVGGYRADYTKSESRCWACCDPLWPIDSRITEMKRHSPLTRPMWRQSFPNRSTSAASFSGNRWKSKDGSRRKKPDWTCCLPFSSWCDFRNLWQGGDDRNSKLGWGSWCYPRNGPCYASGCRGRRPISFLGFALWSPAKAYTRQLVTSRVCFSHGCVSFKCINSPTRSSEPSAFTCQMFPMALSACFPWMSLPSWLLVDFHCLYL